MKVIKIILILLLVTLVIIQFIRPEKNEAGYASVENFEKETKPSEAVSVILRESCYDCHSDHTRYPWYSEIAPFSYWLQDHIVEGKKHFDVSQWENYSIKKKEHKLKEVIEQLEKSEMPLDSYAFIHGDISREDKKLLMQWAGIARLQYRQRLEVSVK